MADTSYKVLGENDKVTTRTLLHEAIPITGTIVSGTYGEWLNEDNIKNYSHGMFQSVYDYPYLSSSANQIFDITIGVSDKSPLYGPAMTVQKSKKRNIYNQMAQVLVGYDVTGSVLQFDEDGDFLAGGRKINDAIFVNFSRLLTKDEIKKETFEMIVGTDKDFNSPFSDNLKIIDLSGSTKYKVNSPVGEYGILYATNSAGGALNIQHPGYETIGVDKYIKCGLIYYQAGVVVLTSSLFSTNYGNKNTNLNLDTLNQMDWSTTSDNIAQAFQISEISASANALRHRIKNIQFNNTTELNSTIYFCRANHNEFNYSANPTYLSASKIRIKTTSTDVPISYITTIGLYNDRRELLAVAKLSEPLKKTPDTEFTLRVRLDY